jgi:hypothetical protein
MFWLIMVPPQAAQIHGLAVAKTDDMRAAMIENMTLAARGVYPVLLMPN